VGTTGAKVALVDENGFEAHEKCSVYARYSSGTIVCDGKVEQVPEDWYDAVAAACRDIMSRSTVIPSAIVLSGQMQNTILLSNKECSSLGNAILYSDARASKEANFIEEFFGGRDELQELTGLYTGASSVLAKLLWLKQHKKHLLNKCDKIVVGAHSYICWKMCGKTVCDFTTASTTSLLNMKHWPPIWLKDEIEQLGIDSTKLPDLQSALSVTGYLTEMCAKDLQLPKGLPVIHGSGDMGSTSVGAGAGIVGGTYAYIGTSGWVATARSGYVKAPQGGFTMLHPDPTLSFNVASMMTAGGNLEWLRQVTQEANFPAEKGLEQISELASTSPAGSKGVYYLPYLAGERSPFEDPDIRGAFIGLGLETTQCDMYRAVMEGVACAYRSLLTIVLGEEYPAFLSSLWLVGGGAKSKIWPQIMADVLKIPVRTESLDNSRVVDVATKGAAMIASVAMGWKTQLGDGEACNIKDNQLNAKTLLHIPNQKVLSIYDNTYAKFLHYTELMRKQSSHTT